MNQQDNSAKKPVVIDAIQWTGQNLYDVIWFVSGQRPDITSNYAGMMWDNYTDLVEKEGLIIPTLGDGAKNKCRHSANIGDWIIRGINGEYYPCNPNINAITDMGIRFSTPAELTSALRRVGGLHEISVEMIAEEVFSNAQPK